MALVSEERVHFEYSNGDLKRVLRDVSYFLVLCATAERQVLGELLLDFLNLFGEDFDVSCEGFSVRGGGFRFNCHENPPHPQAGDPIVIEVTTMKINHGFGK